MKTFGDPTTLILRRWVSLVATMAAALVAVAPASALRAQIGNPFNPYTSIGGRDLWVREPEREDGLIEESDLWIGPRLNGAQGARLADRSALVPGLPLLPDNCGRLPFTSELELECSGSITRTIVDLGPGDDSLSYGLSARSSLSGGFGDDYIVGGPAADRIDGGWDDDTAYGLAGADYLNGGYGSDILRGGDGDDDLFALGDGGDTLEGEAGADSLRDVSSSNGAGGPDQLLGGPGDDEIVAAFGDDSLDGGDGADLLIGGSGGDTFAGGPGIDTVDYSSRSLSLFVTFDAIANDGETNEGDFIRSDVENLLGGSANDVLGGSGFANRLYGGRGADSLSGGGGGDWLSGDGGNDVVDGGTGTDNVLGGGDNDRLRGGPGDDLLSGGTGGDFLEGGLGGDVLNGGDGNDLIEARDGAADKISCGVGYDEARVDPVDLVAADCERIVRAR